MVPVILMLFVNLVLKFKLPVKRVLYAKVDCSHLNPDAKRLMEGAYCRKFFHFLTISANWTFSVKLWLSMSYFVTLGWFCCYPLIHIIALEENIEISVLLNLQMLWIWKNLAKWATVILGLQNEHKNSILEGMNYIQGVSWL